MSFKDANQQICATMCVCICYGIYLFSIVMTLMVMLDTEISKIPKRVCHPRSHQNGSCCFMFFNVAYDFVVFLNVFYK